MRNTLALWKVGFSKVRRRSEDDLLQNDSEAVDVSFLSSVDRSSCHTQQLRCCPQLTAAKFKPVYLKKKQFSHFGEANISFLFNRYSISHENVYECSRLQDVATYLAATLCLGKPGSLLHLIANNSERLQIIFGTNKNRFILFTHTFFVKYDKNRKPNRNTRIAVISYANTTL